MNTKQKIILKKHKRLIEKYQELYHQLYLDYRNIADQNPTTDKIKADVITSVIDTAFELKEVAFRLETVAKAI